MRAKSSKVAKRNDHLTTIRIPVELHKIIVALTDYNAMSGLGESSVNTFIVNSLKQRIIELEKDPVMHSIISQALAEANGEEEASAPAATTPQKKSTARDVRPMPRKGE